MKICSLCKSKYDDRVDFCFRDGTPLVPSDDAESADEAPSDDLFSSATRPFVVQPDGSGMEPDALDVPEAPDRFASGDGLDAPEPRFGFDTSALDAPEPPVVAGVSPRATDVPDPGEVLDAPEPVAFDATDVPQSPSFLDAPEPAGSLDVPEPAALDGGEPLPPPRPVEMDADPELSLAHSDTMVPPVSDDSEPPEQADQEPGNRPFRMSRTKTKKISRPPSPP